MKNYTAKNSTHLLAGFQAQPIESNPHMKHPAHLLVGYSVEPNQSKTTLIERPQKSMILSALNRLWQTITTINVEPRVWKKHDRYGNVYWRTYDPATDRLAWFDTEEEVRRWIEERYAQ